ncbi:MAG: hypothetical protein B6U72_01425 [Candidatus Altiarchaeales archaeon ex4484_2]|nr:MAG: hypothetical protein B6U72_01425 [Candidatus Altiarchaeales archaeon ex4484_2]
MAKESLPRVYVGVMFVSASALMLQIALTRVFSISQYHHFAFMVVSIAFLGFAASGTFLSIKSSLIEGETGRYLAELSLLYSVSAILSFILTQQIPFDPHMVTWDRNQLIYLLLYYMLLAVPFFISGLVIGLVIARIPKRVGEVYFYNMAGSGLGSIVVVYLAFHLAVENLIVAASLTGLLAAMVFPRGGNRIRAAAVFFLIAFLVAQPFLEVKVSSYKSLNRLLNSPGAKIIGTEWNPHSRVDLIKSKGVRYLPGLSLAYAGAIPEQYGLTLDGGSPNAITFYDGNISQVKYLSYMSSSLGYILGERDRVLLINPRGGLGVLTALYYNSSRIDAVESNPSVIKLTMESNISGGIYNHERVDVEVENSRSFIRRSPQKYDLIVLAVTDDVLASSTGLYSLSEDYLHTVQAFKEYFTHLSGDGILLVTRWLQYPPRELPRTVSIAVTALESDGVDNPGNHMALLRGYSFFTLLVKKKPFTIEEADAVREFASNRFFDIVHLPNVTMKEVNRFNRFPNPVYYEMTESILEKEERQSIYSEYLFDVSPSTDDKPFYSSFFRLDKILPLYRSMGEKWEPFFEGGFLSLFVLLQGSILTLVLVLLPQLYYQRITLQVEKKTLILYFFLIGLGYMFMEISLIQRFILFLGQPFYSISIIIASLLISSGLGSLFSSRLDTRKLGTILFIIPLLLLTYHGVLSTVFNAFLGDILLTRVFISFILLFPLGFVLGMPFPLAVRIADKINKRLVPWGWCSNLSASVLGPVLAATIALYFGFTSVFMLAAISYLACLLLVRYSVP